jgi:monoamine oxidase
MESITTSNRTDENVKYFAIIIGAGASGLAAAKYLHSLGRSYVVLEAQDRIGGRVWTVSSENDGQDANTRNEKETQPVS